MIARGRLQGVGVKPGTGAPQPLQTPRQSRGEMLLTPSMRTLLRGSAQENGLAGANPAECGHFKDYRIQCHLSLPKNLSSVFPNPTSPKHVLES